MDFEVNFALTQLPRVPTVSPTYLFEINYRRSDLLSEIWNAIISTKIALLNTGRASIAR